MRQLEVHRGEASGTLESVSIVLDEIPAAQETKQRRVRLFHYKPTHIHWEKKILSNYISNRTLMSRMYKNLEKLTVLLNRDRYPAKRYMKKIFNITSQ